MERITEKQLEAVVERINRMTGSPLASYTKQADGSLKANIGNYHLDYAYGSVGLVRMHNESGGVESIISLDTKRGLYNRMHAYCAGLSQGKELVKA